MFEVGWNRLKFLSSYVQNSKKSQKRRHIISEYFLTRDLNSRTSFRLLVFKYFYNIEYFDSRNIRYSIFFRISNFRIPKNSIFDFFQKKISFLSDSIGILLIWYSEKNPNAEYFDYWYLKYSNISNTKFQKIFENIQYSKCSNIEYFWKFQYFIRSKISVCILHVHMANITCHIRVVFFQEISEFFRFHIL